MDEDLRSKVHVNTNNISWIKQAVNDLKRQSRQQTALLFGILITLLGSIVTLVIT